MLENIKLFTTNTDRSTYEEGDNYMEPYVSLVEGDNSVHYNKGGDTPEETRGFKFDAGGFNYVIAGTLGHNENLLVAQVYKNGDAAMMFDENGKAATTSWPIDNTFARRLCNAITNTFGEQCETYIFIDSPVASGESIENWDLYQLVQ